MKTGIILGEFRDFDPDRLLKVIYFLLAALQRTAPYILTNKRATLRKYSGWAILAAQSPHLLTLSALKFFHWHEERK